MRPTDVDALPIRKAYIVDEAGFEASFYVIDIENIDCVPTIDAVPVVHGWWEWCEVWLPSTPEHPAECEECGWRCGRCKNTLENMVGGYWDDPFEKPKLKYCPECGAKMEGEVDG